MPLSAFLLMPSRTQTRPRISKLKLAKKLPAEAEAWVRRTQQKMTVEEKLGQLLMTAFYGGALISPESDSFRELARQVETMGIGAMIVEPQAGPMGLELSQAFPTAAIVNRLQRLARIPLLVAGDFERGTAMRLADGTSFPHAMAIAATGRPEDARTVGRITALEAQAVGAPWIFAPVADVNSDPENPIINIRSFGEDPRRVSEFITAYVRGVREGGGLATAKHFPGHGATKTDSHLELPYVGSDRARMEEVELTPFRAAIAAAVDTMMTGHLAVPALEPEAGVPATLSPKIIGGLLRDEMGFSGLVISDSLDMGGVATSYSPGEAAVLALLAGCDVLLVRNDPDAALAALREAVASGRLPASRVDEAVMRILRAKARLGLHKRRTVDLEALPDVVGRPEFRRAAQDIGDRGVTLLRDTAHRLPLDTTRPLRVLLAAIAGDPDPQPGRALENEIRARVDALHVLRADTRFFPSAGLALPLEDSYDVMVVALFVRVADRKGTVGLPADEEAAVHRLLGTGKPAIVSYFGSPYLAARFPEAKTWMAIFSSADVGQRAAGRAIFGQTAIGGRLPVSVPGVAPAGAGMDVSADSMQLMTDAALAEKLAPTYSLLDRAAAEGAFPGGVVAVGQDNRLAVRAFGRLNYERGAAAVTPETIYDAASLTKPVVTATLTAMLYESGAMDLDEPIARYTPEWMAGPNPEWRRRVTVRHLLTHTSGLAAHEKYFENVRERRKIVAGVLAAQLEEEPGAQALYSDLGFILLGEILERLTGRTLAQLASSRIFAPLGMMATGFVPAKSQRPRIAPTEEDAEGRRGIIRGEVHDGNAWAMGGVAGHAGIFATAKDLAVFCQMTLNGGVYRHMRLLRRETVGRFTAPQPVAAGTRTLGWIMPTPDSSSGHHFSPRSFGHTGFTGTSMWIDPDKELFVVLLTNRVHPTRENDRIRQVRPAVHDAVVEALGLAPAAT